MPKPDDIQLVSIKEVNDLGMVVVKANFLDNKIYNAFQTAIVTPVPKIGKISMKKNLSVAWMAIDEYAIFIERCNSQKMVDHIVRKMKKFDILCVNMSDSRTFFRLVGKGWREVLSKGTPADLSTKVFGVGSFRRTRIANVAIAVWVVDENEAYLFSMRSVSEYVQNWLQNANLKSSQLKFFY